MFLKHVWVTSGEYGDVFKMLIIREFSVATGRIVNDMDCPVASHDLFGPTKLEKKKNCGTYYFSGLSTLKTLCFRKHLEFWNNADIQHYVAVNLVRPDIGHPSIPMISVHDTTQNCFH